jgi:hypothetical protein
MPKVEKVEKRHGGARASSGMKKGQKTKKTIEREAARKAYQQLVFQNLGPLFTAQFSPSCSSAKHRWGCEMLNKATPYLMNGGPKLCAGCGQPFIIRGGRDEAIVGQNNQLYCFGTTCEADALEARVVRKRRAS